MKGLEKGAQRDKEERKGREGREGLVQAQKSDVTMDLNEGEAEWSRRIRKELCRLKRTTNLIEVGEDDRQVHGRRSPARQTHDDTKAGPSPRYMT